MKHSQNQYYCYVCDSTDHREVSRLHQKPKGETDYGIPDSKYDRVITQCLHCTVYTNQHDLLSSAMYEGDYNASIALGDIRERYDKVMNLAPEKSDNRQRVKRITDFLLSKNLALKDCDVLDVGSGTCVFLGALQEAGPRCACVDPDPKAIAHAKEYVGIPLAHCGTLENFPTDNTFDLITFNKVLEHVKDPVSMLQESGRLLKKDGFVYVELPEGGRADQQGIAAERQEFFVEHYTVFNETSFHELAHRAGFEAHQLNIITEPSGKLTIYGFLSKKK
ncbi:class I SAM-dependent methyltransferase [Catalinimonas niigatensis]|uniref:class I SAM-dependent methyltransferase n=1 Tax=Catalinimonas niigatensis TaxID=1397264 RepID=UPI00266704B1|nr:class I SAM-dependent methyltransferase [Catalinimonas niigatensis]WPP50489.1 class I SAM-dependent methyltransferase [Catalinimonas niigatensis]